MKPIPCPGHVFLLSVVVLSTPYGQPLSAQPTRPDLDHRPSQALQRADAIDSDDSYPTPKGVRRLLRLPEAVAVRYRGSAESSTVRIKLTRTGGSLDGYELFRDAGNGYEILRKPRRDAQRQAAAITQGHLALTTIRADSEILSASPVFVEPESGLLLIATEELVLRLQPSTDPAAYFGDDLKNTRPLRGTTDQYILSLPSKTAEEILQEVNQRASDPRVVWVEPNFLGEIVMHFTPNDPLFAQQWHLNNTGQGGGTPDADVYAVEAWDITTGSSNVVIAILDNGIQLDHPDLQPNIFTNSADPVNGMDDDGNGYLDDVNGWDFYSGNNNPNPKNANDNHGTAVAGVAAAVGNNGLGISGIAPGCKILPIRIATGSSSFVSASKMAEAIYYAAGRASDGIGRWPGADVLNMSFGGSSTLGYGDALNWAATEGAAGRGCAIFAASGNNGSGSVYFPARHADVMAVGASTDLDDRADYSQFGSKLDLVAPSHGGISSITTTDRTGANGYNRSSGAAGNYAADFGYTSSACPLAAGVGALIRCVAPWHSPAAIRAILQQSADKIGQVAYSNGRNDYFGYGRVNAAQAVTLGTQWPGIITPPTNTLIMVGGAFTLSAVVTGSPPVSIQWQFNGTNLPAANNASFTSTSVRYADAGLYTAVVTNNSGGTTSRAGTVLVGPVVAWGGNGNGQTTVPASATNVVGVAAGSSHSLALRADGTVVAWGANSFGQTNVPASATNVVGVAAGRDHALALRADGTVVAWGANNDGQTNVPAMAKNMVAVAAGDSHSLALRTDGSVVAWGYLTSVPSGLSNVVAVAACRYTSLALRADGTVVAWGSNLYDQANVPASATNVVDVAAGEYHALALRADGTVVAWGANNFGQTNVPAMAKSVVAVAAGFFHSVALRADGTVVAWGYNVSGQANVPAGLSNVVAVASGGAHNLALVSDLPQTPPRVPSVSRSGNVVSIGVPTAVAKTYLLEYKNSLDEPSWHWHSLSAGDGTVKTLTDSDASGSQRFYRVRRF